MHLLQGVAQRLQFRLDSFRLVAFNQLGSRAVEHVADCRHYLQLRSTFVNGQDTGIAVIAFHREILHIAGSPVNLDRIVSHLVGIFAGEHLQDRRQQIRVALVELHLGTLFGRQLLPFVHHGGIGLAQIHGTGGFVQYRTGSIQFGLHQRQHLIDGRELDNRLAELLAFAGILQSRTVSSLGNAHRLSADPETSPVHQRHHVFDQTQLAVAHQFGRRIGKYQFASRRAFDTELVLDTPYPYPAPVAVMHEIRQAAAVVRAFFRTGQYQFDIGIPVGDETLHPVEHPHALGFVISSLQLHGLQVRTGIRLGQVHRAGLAIMDPRQELVLDILAGVFVNGLGAVLQAPDIGKARIPARHDFGRHHVRHIREIQTVVLARQSDAINPGTGQHIVVLLRATGILHMAVNNLRTFVIHILGIHIQHIGRNIADDFHHLFIAVHRVFEVLRRVIVFFLVRVSILFHVHAFAHRGMIEMKLQRFVITVKIHNLDFRCF